MSLFGGYETSYSRRFGDYAASEAASTSISSDFPTPSSTADSDATATIEDKKANEVAPWPEKTFIIRENNTHLMITVVGGGLKVCDHITGRGGFHWECVEKNGWLGFCNSVSGTLIGHNSRGAYIAAATLHRQYEGFCARRHPEGGYILVTRHSDNLLSMKVGLSGTLVETKDEGTRWEFITASEYPDCHQL